MGQPATEQNAAEVFINQTALKQAELRAQGQSILQSFIGGDDWSDDDDDDNEAATSATVKTSTAKDALLLLKGNGDDLCWGSERSKFRQ
ncbi:hypothetical protein DV735_g2083, partial [Chaetothyriales sp. CBS 134920]